MRVAYITEEKKTQNHWSFSDKKFLVLFLSRHWTEFRKLKILGMGGEVITGIIEKTQHNWSKEFFSQIHEKWSFCDFYNRIFFFLFRRCCCSLASHSHSQTDDAQFKGELRFRKNFHQESLYKNTLYENTVQKPSTWNTLHKHSVCSPALEILNEVHQSIPLRMWSYTKNLGWSSSVDPTPYVVLHEESWLKFISPIQWILSSGGLLSSFFWYLGHDFFSFHSPPPETNKLLEEL